MINKLEQHRIRTDYLELCKSMLTRQPICVEIGVLRGEFSKLIIDILQPRKLHLVDPWEIGHDKNDTRTEQRPGLPTAYSDQNCYTHISNIFSEQISSSQVELHRMFSYDAVDLFQDKYFDFIYIDATHFYEPVMEDIKNYFPKLKDTGILCGHDYGGYWKEVTKAVNDSCEIYNLSVHHVSDFGDWIAIRND